jgi:hypothetical protein
MFNKKKKFITLVNDGIENAVKPFCERQDGRMTVKKNGVKY